MNVDVETQAAIGERQVLADLKVFDLLVRHLTEPFPQPLGRI
jgi:hypothetical protein